MTTDRPPVTVRPATLADAETITAFNLALALESEDLQLDPAVVNPGVRRALESTDRALYFVAVDAAGALLGQIMVTYEWTDWRNGWLWWIQSVYVTPTARRRGVYRQLFEHVRNLARTRGDVRGLNLYVHHANTPAMQCYERLGMSRAAYQIYECRV